MNAETKRKIGKANRGRVPWNKKPLTLAERSALYRWRHPAKVKHAVQVWQTEHPDYDRRWRYGITQVEFNRVLHEVQHDLCAVCGLPFENSFDTTIDHNHVTGQFRGVVHRKCNRFISHVEHNEPLIQKAREYLTRSESK